MKKVFVILLTIGFLASCAPGHHGQPPAPPTPPGAPSAPPHPPHP